jgi:hypothetical protein
MATLIRAYADKARAQRLHDELLSAGLPGDRVKLLHGGASDTAGHAPGAPDRGEESGERGVLSSIGHVLVSALGGDTPDAHTGRYTEALQRGESVITVSAQSPSEEDLARAILDGAGPTGAAR